MAKSWEEFGKRVQAARKDAKLTQEELASKLNLERTAVTPIEAGLRTVASLELSQLARALRRPIGWFVTEPSSAVVSRREDRGDVVRREDVHLETLVQDVEQLITLEVLRPVTVPRAPIETLDEAESVALATRRLLELRSDQPVWDLVPLLERVGLYTFVLDLGGGDDAPEGSYIALDQGGVALIGNARESGRRRFTIAHELGHHMLADKFAPEWIIGAGASDWEKVINAFAIHFLLPRQAAEQRWKQHDGNVHPRDATIRIAVEFGLSWSAACAQLQRVGCLIGLSYEAIAHTPPRQLEFIELELMVRSDVNAPLVPPSYAAAVVRALKKGKIGPNRAIELLHGTAKQSDLSPERLLSLDAMTAELDGLPA